MAAPTGCEVSQVGWNASTLPATGSGNPFQAVAGRHDELEELDGRRLFILLCSCRPLLSLFSSSPATMADASSVILFLFFAS